MPVSPVRCHHASRSRSSSLPFAAPSMLPLVSPLPFGGRGAFRPHDNSRWNAILFSARLGRLPVLTAPNTDAPSRTAGFGSHCRPLPASPQGSPNLDFTVVAPELTQTTLWPIRLSLFMAVYPEGPFCPFTEVIPAVNAVCGSSGFTMHL